MTKALIPNANNNSEATFGTKCRCQDTWNQFFVMWEKLVYFKLRCKSILALFDLLRVWPQ